MRFADVACTTRRTGTFVRSIGEARTRVLDAACHRVREHEVVVLPAARLEVQLELAHSWASLGSSALTWAR
jgi:hypothetical protein